MTDQRPRLSLCAIVKDEAQRLPRCLASVAGVVDEMVITDTGSTDDTVAIAERAGATVHHFAWCDDFSAAYNHSLDHATGEWILLLDADEELVPGSRDEIHRLIQREEAFAFTMLRQDFYSEVGGEHFSEMLQTRLFRRRDAVRFQGRIHQQLEPTLSRQAAAEGRAVLESNVRLLHYGYLGDYKNRKQDRSIRLLELELEARPDQFYYLVELGRTKLAAGDSAGFDVLRRAAEQVATGRQPIDPGAGALALLLEELLAANQLPADFPINYDRAAEIAEEHFSDSIPLLWQRALKQFQAGRFADCAKLLERVRSLAESDSYSKLCSFDPRIMRGDALLNLGVCYARMAKFDQAARCFERLKDDPQHAEQARANLNAIRRLGKRR